MTVIDVSAGAVTIKGADPLIEPEAAVIVVVPSPVLVARPLLPAVLLIVATLVDVELHVTVLVISGVVPSV